MPNDVINTVTINGTQYNIGGSGGHTIKNPAGTAMTQRSNLQFVDLTISDDSTNDTTKVESVHVIHSESELNNLPDGLYMLDEDEETVIDGNLVGYDNTTSGLNAENVQDAIDEVAETLDDKIDISVKGTANGVAELDENGKVPSAQLPSYVDDVLEYSSISAFPATGETGKIYVTLDTNKTYRWGGTEYVEISESLALGETSSTAYRGDRGKAAYDHSQITSGNPHNVTKSDVGLGNVDNTSDKNKPLSDATKEALLMKIGIEAITHYYEPSMTVEMGRYAEGSNIYVESEGRMYRATTDIDIGDTLVVDTNCVPVDVQYMLIEKLGVDDLTTIVEPVDRASSAHTMYSRFYLGYLNKWAKATANIAVNDMLVMGTNYEIITIEEVFGSIESVLSQMSTSISNKVNKETGKGLSTNDYTTTDKNKVSKIDTTTTSISGNPISISGLKANQLAKNPIITLEPIQDLHGQSKPYPAGGGKNKYGSGDVSGTQNTTVNLSIPTGTYTISAVCTSSDTDASTCLALVRYTDTTYHAGVQLQRTNRSSATLILAKQAASITFYASDTNAHSSGDTFTVKSIQIEEGTQPTSYAPYENICPISGYDKIEVLSCGKNLCEETIINATIGTDGTIITSGGTSFDMHVARVLQGVTYTIKSDEAQSVSQQFVGGFFYSKPALNSVSYNGTRLANTSATFISPITGYVAFRTSRGYTVAQCEYGSSQTTYEAPNKTTDLSESLGQTVYHAIDNVRSGKIDVDSADYTLTGSETWTAWGTGAYYSQCLTKTAPSTQGTVNVFACEFAESKTVTNIYNGISGIAVASNNIYISGDIYANISSLTGKKLIYEIATHSSIQLTPHEISLLKDYAYVSTNGTNIAFDYHNGELASLGDVSQLGETVNELGEYINRDADSITINLSNYDSAISGYLYLLRHNNIVTINLYDVKITTDKTFSSVIPSIYSPTSSRTRVRGTIIQGGSSKAAMFYLLENGDIKLTGAELNQYYYGTATFIRM